MSTTIEELEARLADLETDRCVCGDCIAARKERARMAIRRRYAMIEALPADERNATIAAMSIDERREYLRDAPLHVYLEARDEDRDQWLGHADQFMRDTVRLHRMALPERDRLLFGYGHAIKNELLLAGELEAPNRTYSPSPIPLDKEARKRFESVGLKVTERLSRVVPLAKEYVFAGLSVPGIVTRPQLDLVRECDSDLERLIASGEILVQPLSDDENREYQRRLWQDERDLQGMVARYRG